jgi:hypothetical protein
VGTHRGFLDLYPAEEQVSGLTDTHIPEAVKLSILWQIECQNNHPRIDRRVNVFWEDD